MIEVYSTSKLRGKEKLEYWNDCICSQFTKLESEPFGDQGFNASLSAKEYNKFSIANPVTTGSKVTHSNHHVKHANDRVFLVHLQMQGASVNRQGENTAILKPGDFTVCDSARPYSVEFERDISMLVVRIDETEFSRRLPYFKQTGVRISGSEGLGAMASNMMQGFWKLPTDNMDLAVQNQLSRNLLDVLSTCYLDMTTVSKETIRDTRKQKILSFISMNLDDENLSPTMVAKSTNISVGYLHKLFRESDTTVNNWIIKQRLLRAETILRTGNGRDVMSSITEIAYDVGFKDVSHFCNRFKSEFGITPKEMLHETSSLRTLSKHS